MKKILVIITLALTIAAVSAYTATKEKASEQPIATPFIVTDPSGGGI